MSHNGFTTEQTESLGKMLDPAFVKARKQGGTEVSYVTAWHAIAEANRIFGYDGWMRETTEARVVQERPTTIGKGKSYEKPGFVVSYVAKVKITVFAGERVVVREGTGAGHGIDADMGQAHESAIKEAESDAMKRALMMFGNQFGLALYDKEQSNVGYDAPAPSAEMTALSDDLAAINEKPALDKWMADNKTRVEALVEFERAAIKRMCGAKLKKFKEQEAQNVVSQ